MSNKQAQPNPRDGDEEDEPPTLLERLKMAKITVQIAVMIQRLLT